MATSHYQTYRNDWKFARSCQRMVIILLLILIFVTIVLVQFLALNTFLASTVSLTQSFDQSSEFAASLLSPSKNSNLNAASDVPNHENAPPLSFDHANLVNSFRFRKPNPFPAISVDHTTVSPSKGEIKVSLDSDGRLSPQPSVLPPFPVSEWYNTSNEYAWTTLTLDLADIPTLASREVCERWLLKKDYIVYERNYSHDPVTIFNSFQDFPSNECEDLCVLTTASSLPPPLHPFDAYLERGNVDGDGYSVIRNMESIANYPYLKSAIEHTLSWDIAMTAHLYSDVPAPYLMWFGDLVDIIGSIKIIHRHFLLIFLSKYFFMIHLSKYQVMTNLSKYYHDSSIKISSHDSSIEISSHSK